MCEIIYVFQFMSMSLVLSLSLLHLYMYKIYVVLFLLQLIVHNINQVLHQTERQLYKGFVKKAISAEVGVRDLCVPCFAVRMTVANSQTAMRARRGWSAERTGRSSTATDTSTLRITFH